VEPQQVEPQQVEPQQVEPQQVEPQQAEPQQVSTERAAVRPLTADEIATPMPKRWIHPAHRLRNPRLRQ
jgi:hypothetical protein